MARYNAQVGRFIAVAIVIGSAVVAACFSQPTRPSATPPGDGGPGNEGGVPDGDGGVTPHDAAPCMVESFDDPDAGAACGTWAFGLVLGDATIGQHDDRLRMTLPGASPQDSIASSAICPSNDKWSLARASIQLVQVHNTLSSDTVKTFFRVKVGPEHYGFELANVITGTTGSDAGVDGGVTGHQTLSFRCNGQDTSVQYNPTLHGFLELRRTAANQLAAYVLKPTSKEATQLGTDCDVALDDVVVEVGVSRGSGNDDHIVKFDELELCPK